MKASDADKLKAAPKLADLEPPAAAAADHAHGHGHPMESVRTASHCGHEIVIRTRYEITVDGKPLDSHLSVDDDGHVHTHALPEYAFTSAVDVVKKIIDAFPSEFPCDDHGGTGSSSGRGHGHGGHSH